MITHPVARTRALYKWEHDYLEGLTDNDIMSENELRKFAAHVWKEEGSKRSCPRIHRVGPKALRATDGLPYCAGRSDIYLDRKNSHKIILIHELTHGLGYGSQRNPHNVAFVRKYLEMVVKHISRNTSEAALFQRVLFDVARGKGLL